MAGQPAPALFSDNLWNTAILPATTTIPGGTKKNDLPASFNGANWAFTEPVDDEEDAFIAGVNTTIRNLCYNDIFNRYNCLFDSGVYPCRYVVMHSTGTGQNMVAHQLIVTSPGQSTFETTNWRSPPY
jgi:hypothetical protein